MATIASRYYYYYYYYYYYCYNHYDHYCYINYLATTIPPYQLQPQSCRRRRKIDYDEKRQEKRESKSASTACRDSFIIKCVWLAQHVNTFSICDMCYTYTSDAYVICAINALTGTGI
jgi:heme exporter protein D